MLAISTPVAALARDTQPPVITHSPCRWYSVGAPVVITVDIEDESPLYDPKVMVQQQSQWVRVPLEPNPTGGYRATAPATNADPMRYFIEVMDENGNGPARFGSPDSPVELRPARAPGACMEEVPPGRATQAPPASTCGGTDPPLYCSAAFWGVTGAAVALVGAGVVVYFATRDPKERPGHDGITLEITGPPPTRDGLWETRR